MMLKLEGGSDSLLIASEFWNEILDWAEENGWIPEHARSYYLTPNDHLVSEQDAENLAETLEFIAGDLVLHEFHVSDRFMRELIDCLSNLVVFCYRGSFRIKRTHLRPPGAPSGPERSGGDRSGSR